MNLKRPSPAMVVACVALFVALGGTSIAAVNYARNAGKVDGKSAVRANRSLNKAAGNLVATYRHGRLKGQIAHKFLAETALARPFGKYLTANDNVASAPVTLVGTGSLGSLTATCSDQAAKPGVEDPTATITYANNTGQPVNVASRVGNGAARVGGLATGTVWSVTINNSNTFEFTLNQFGRDTRVEGVFRQDGTRSADAHCLLYGTAEQATAR